MSGEEYGDHLHECKNDASKELSWWIVNSSTCDEYNAMNVMIMQAWIEKN